MQTINDRFPMGWSPGYSRLALYVLLALLVTACQSPPPSSDTPVSEVPTAQRLGEAIATEVCVECHDVEYEAIRSGPHWMVDDQRTPGARHQCATCHGDLAEHVEGADAAEADGMRTFGVASTLSAAEQNRLCSSCHRERGLLHWPGSAHDAEDVGCVGCHRMHSEDRVRSREDQQAVCLDCHRALRADLFKPYTHPLREHTVGCSDCHAAHGGPGDHGLRDFSVNETCYRCHAEKRGPFLWEHAPVSEDCMLCHDAHGSVNRGMLDSRQPQLCQSCHEPTGAAHNPLGPHAQHSRLGLGFPDQDSPGGGDGTETRGSARFVLGEACLNCHGMVHGSNHPAGAMLLR